MGSWRWSNLFICLFLQGCGRTLAIERGVKMGRKVSSVKSKEQKAEEYANVIRSLRKGKSIRDTAKLCDVSISTVQRVKREFAL